MELTRPRGNLLLAALPPPVLRRLEVRHQCVRVRDVLVDSFAEAIDVFFPHEGTVLSLIRGTDEGQQVEVGLVSAEGLVGLTEMMTPGADGTFALVQIAGDISRVAGRRLRAELLSDHTTRGLMLAYMGLAFEHLTQSVVCNRVHSIEQRLSRWLLTIRDRVHSDELFISHDFLSKMLGIQRSGVTIAVGVLSESQLISHSRKHIQVVDARGLAKRACECHGLMLDKLNGYRSQLSGRASGGTR